ncbi:hypothetical protein [Scytonema sp. PCC 10023]|uniref:hypothetical protein n=1 Tax=Scytonema sp. PCC 10023 TaxID=1680591 RepID=UPI0039C6FDF6
MSNIIEIPAAQIKPLNFSCGDVLDGSDGNQYRIIDHIEGDEEIIVVLERLDDDERLATPKFLDGTVEL